MKDLSASTIGLFILTCVGNQLGVLLLPGSRGFTVPLYTTGAVLSYAVGIWALAKLISDGGNISMLIPLMAVVIPLMSVGFGVLYFHEPASWPRIALLVSACALIGFAAVV